MKKSILWITSIIMFVLVSLYFDASKALATGLDGVEAIPVTTITEIETLSGTEEAILEAEVLQPAPTEEAIVEVEALQPAETEEAIVEADPVQPAETEESTDEAEAVQPAETKEAIVEADPVQPAETEESTDEAEAVQPAETEEAIVEADPVQPAETEESTDEAEAVQPSETEESIDEAEPAASPTVADSSVEEAESSMLLAAEAAAIAKLLFTFDDGAKETITLAAPILAENGFTGTAYVGESIEVQDWAVSGMMTEADLEALYSVYGWDLANHSANHMWLGDRTDAATIEAFQQDYLDNQNWLLANGWTRGAYHVAYAGGSYNEQLIASLKEIGVDTARTTIYGVETSPVNDYYKLKTVNVVYGLEYVKGQIDEAVSTGSPIILMIHGINDSGQNYTITPAEFQEIVDYVTAYTNQGRLGITTISDWYDSLVGPVETIPLESITLDQPELSLNQGTSAVLTVIYEPENTTENKIVRWTSSDSTIVTVDAAGKVTAMESGTATIKATVGSQTAISEVTVIEAASIAKLLFTFDDGAKETITFAAPILAENGFTGTAYVGESIEVQDWAVFGMMTEADLEALYSVYGWDLANHSANHMWLGDRTDAATIEAFQQDYLDNQNWLLANGWTRGAYHVAYAGGSYNEQLIASLKEIGVDTARTTIYGVETSPVNDYYKLKTVNVIYGLEYVKGQIDEAVSTGSPIILMIHGINDSGQNYTITPAEFQEIVDYVTAYTNQGRLGITTISDWYDSLVGPVETIPLESITLDQPELSLKQGTSAVLTVIYEPENTTENKMVRWTSSDSAIVTVDAAGKVTAIESGTATIKATVGSQTAISEVTVIEAASIAKLLFTFDDGAKETITFAAPVLAEKGFAGTAYVGESIPVQDWAVSGMMTEADLEVLYSTYGWDLGNHSTSHLWLGDRTDAATIEAFQQDYLDNQNWLLANGWTRGAYHLAYTGGSHNDELIESLKEIGVETARTTIYGLESSLIEDFYRLKTINVLYGLDYVKEQIDDAVSSGSPIILMVHGINNSGKEYVISPAEFQEIVDYASEYSQKGLLDVTTISDWYNSVAKTSEDIPIDSISIDKTTLSLIDRYTEKLTVSYETSSSTVPKIIWTSSNSNVASVDYLGNVMATGLGTATITAKVGTAAVTSTVIVNPVDRENTSDPLSIPTYDGSDQTIHPSVLYFPDAWNGYSYWMAHTPYPYADASYENPSISVSNDGVNWTSLSGLSNPIDQPTNQELAGNYHMSDTELVWNNGKLEVWYRFNVNDGTEQLMRKTSTNGVTWSNREIVFDLTDEPNFALSPSVIFEDNKYKMWFVGTEASIYYTESSTGANDSWSPLVTTKLDYYDDTYDPWHIDVIEDENRYVLVISTTLLSDGGRNLLIGESSDGVNFDDLRVILTPSSDGWDDKEIYRASLIHDNTGYRLYYSARSVNNEWRTGLLE